MSFIRRIKRKSGVYLAEVENKWVKGKVVQRHLRYVLNPAAISAFFI